MAADQVVGLRLDLDASDLKKELAASGKAADELAGDVQGMGGKIDRVLSGLVGSAGNVEQGIRDVDQRLSMLTGADREVVLRANVSQAEAGIRQIDQMLSDPTLTDTEIRIALDKRNEATRKVEELKEQLAELGPAAAEAGDDIERGLNLGAIGGAIAGAGISSRLDEAVTSTGQLRAQLGLTAEEVRRFDDIAREVYQENYGETMGEAARVTGMVHQSLGLVGDDLGDFAKLLFSVSDAFEPLGADTQILLEDVRAIVNNFPGTTEVEALDLIAHGFQTGAGNAGDLQDTLQEYPGDFSRIGLEADDMIGIIVAGMDAGMRNTDMMADAVREMGIRITTAGDTGQRALQRMFPASEADRLIRAFSEGGQAGRDAFFQIMEGLLAIEDPQARYNRAVEIMGSRGEEIINQLPHMRDGLAEVRDRTIDAGGAAESTTTQYDSLRNTLETLVRKLESGTISTVADVGGGFAEIATAAGTAAFALRGVGEYLPGLTRHLSNAARVAGPLAAALPGVFAAMSLHGNTAERGNEMLANFVDALPTAQTADEFANNIQAMIDKYEDLQGVANTGGPLWGGLQELYQNVNPDVPNLIGDTEAATRAYADAIEAALPDLERWRDNEEEVMRLTGLTAEEVNTLAGTVGADLSAAGHDGAAAVDLVVGAFERGVTPTRDYGDTAEDAAGQVEELENRIKGVNDATRALFDPLWAAQDALLANEDAQRRVEEAGWAVTAASEDYAEAVKREGEESWAAKDAAYRHEQALRDLDAANRDAQRSAIDVTTATNELADKMRAGQIDIAAAEEQIRLWAEQGLLTEEQARDMAEELHAVALKADEIDGRTATLYVRADISSLVAGLEEATLRVMGFNQAHGTNIPVYRGPGVQIEATRELGGWVPGDYGEGVPILAHGREFVINADAASRLGPDVLHALNRGEPMPATYMAPAPVVLSPSGDGGTRAGTTIQQTNHIYGVHSTERTQTEELRRVQLMAP